MGDCLRPLASWPALDGGRPSFTQPASPSSGYSVHAQLVRCRQCPPCRAHQAQQLAYRCVAEHLSGNGEGSFVTLTYADENLYQPLGVPSLHPQHVTKWLKRLRKYYGPVRYLVAGEYGDRYKRPHYHALLFGRTYTKAEIERSWSLKGKPIGHVDVGDLVTPTILYTAQYIEKKLFGALADLHYRGIFPPFHRASQSLGREYLSKFENNTAQDVLWVPGADGGYPVPLPDTLVQYLEKNKPLLHEAISAKRRHAAQAALQGDSYVLHQRRVAAAVNAAKKAALKPREF